MSESDALEMKLEPCPFCGGEARFNLANKVWGTGYVLCQRCRACSDLKREAEAIAAWNTRLSPPPPAVGGEVERLTRENADLRNIMDAMQARHQGQLDAIDLLTTPTLTPNQRGDNG